MSEGKGLIDYVEFQVSGELYKPYLAYCKDSKYDKETAILQLIRMGLIGMGYLKANISSEEDRKLANDQMRKSPLFRILEKKYGKECIEKAVFGNNHQAKTGRGDEIPKNP